MICFIGFGEWCLGRYKEHILATFGKHFESIWQFCVSILIYCLVHFYRGIAKFPEGPFRSVAYDLPMMDSRDDCMAFLEILEIDERYRDWARYYKSELIFQGTNPSCSIRTLEEWDTVQKNFNHVESAHKQTNNVDRDLTLVQAIKT